MQALWAGGVFLAALAFAGSTLIVPDFGGFDPDAFPVPQHQPPAQPAGYAFAIWGLIYLWLILSAGFGLFARREAPDWVAMRPALLLSLGIGATWLMVAKLSPLGAAALIWAMLLAALSALIKAPRLDRWWAQAPIAIYAGWLSAASFVALALVLAGYGVMGAERAAVLCLMLALAFAGTIQARLNNVPEYGAAVIWALVAILFANLDGSLLVAVLAGLGCLTIGYAMLRSATQ